MLAGLKKIRAVFVLSLWKLDEANDLVSFDVLNTASIHKTGYTNIQPKD